MPLEESQKQKFRVWLEERNICPTCASCGSQSWGAGEITSSPILNAEGKTVCDSHVPMVQLVCTKCGYTMNYAAVPIGLP